MTSDAPLPPLALGDLTLCFEGAVPAVVVTASAEGVPNVTYLSRVRMVDDERVALSNQFFTKTARNLAENPRASVLLIDPTTYAQFRLTLVYERTERRGPVFERLRDDVDAIAALASMQDVFKLRAADIYRVSDIEQVFGGGDRAYAQVEGPLPLPVHDVPAALAELSGRLSRCSDLDALVDTTVNGLADLLGYGHSLLLLLDEQAGRLFTIASHGYEAEGVGSEVWMGDGLVGLAAQRGVPTRIGSLGQMAKYSRTIRSSFEDHGSLGPGHEIPLPGLAKAQSRVAVPALAAGQLVGVLLVESTRPVAFGEQDEAVLTVVASLVANAVEIGRSQDRAADAPTDVGGASAPVARPEPVTTTHVKFFDLDGSTFVDGDYLIKGVAGRVLWSLLGHHEREGRVDFTNRELRLDPALDLPAFRDNLESRLILLKRRLEERDVPVSLAKTGRGRFRLVVETRLRLEEVSDGDAGSGDGSA